MMSALTHVQMATGPVQMAAPMTMHSSSRSLNNDTYSGFFSGTSFSQSDSEESFLLSRQEIKQLKKQRVGCASGQCSICFDEYSKGQVIRQLPCGHKFHYKCMKPWLKTQSFCPLCRFDLKAFCSQKVEAQNCEELLERQTQSGELVQAPLKKGPDSDSQTFIEAESMENQSDFHKLSPRICAIQMEESGAHARSQEILSNEELLRLRVMGCETESTASFFGKQHQPKEIYFGIEDDISEIGL